jgi:TonB-linked SusC/RagA family outer membrane protein
MFGSLGYIDQSSMWGDAMGMKRYNVRSNIDVKISENTKVGLDFNGSFQDSRYPGTTGNPKDAPAFILFGMWRLNPTNPIFYSNGKPAGYFERNPYLDLNESGYVRIQGYSNFLTLKLDQKIPFVPGLSAKMNLSLDKADDLTKRWRTPYTFYLINPEDRTFTSAKGNVPKANLNDENNYTRRINGQFLLTYNRQFGQHNLDLLAVFEPRVDNESQLGATMSNYQLLVDELSTSGNGNPADRALYGSSSRVAQVGYVYRANYDWAGRYFLSAAGRYDGQSYFSPVAKYAFFPSFSGAWRVSEEGFMKGITAINNLKVRASWGRVGNLADRGFQYLRLFNVGDPYLFGNNVANSSLSEYREPSPNITWEKATKTDIGLEISMFKSKLNFEIDYFYETRNDMLIASSAVLPSEYGIAIGEENTGKMMNRGVDFSVSSNHSFSNDFSINGSFNFTYAKNKILNINESNTVRNDPNRTQVGKPLNQPFGYKSLGLFQSQAEIDATPYAKALGTIKPGDVKYLDDNNDGKLDNDDIVPIGKSNFPELIYGFVGGMNYKNFTLDFLLQGAGGVSYYLGGWAALPFNQANGVAFKHHTDVWRPDNTDAEFPRILSNPGAYANNNYTSSFWQRNGSYLRLKTLSVGYTFLKPIKGVSSIKVYGAGQNLFTFTKTKYWDPETANSTDAYYQERAISFGATLNF